MKSARSLLGILVVLTLVVAACGRSGDEAEEASEETPEGDGGTEGAGRLGNGEFGDLGTVCQEGEPSGTPEETGVSDEEIQIGTVTDKGADARPGLTQEMYDTAVAFADWCNEHGGINGRELVVNDRDARLTEYPQQVEAGCQEDFAFVGGGAVFDNADAGQRVECGLISIPGYAVTPEARVADLQVQPVPNPVHQYPAQSYLAMQELHPDATNFGVMWVDIPGPSTVHQQVVETVETLGYEVGYDHAYSAMGETGWPTFVQNMQEEGVQGLEFIGEPEYLTSLLAAMETEGWYPEFITVAPNMYDERLVEEAAASANTDIYIRNAFPLFDMGDEVPAIADYIELMETYNSEGRYPALLGAQALSAFLLFATSASECGDDLTRDCVLQAAGASENWTAGGLHAPMTPGNAVAPDCGLLMTFSPDGYSYDEETTQPTDGLFNCSEENQLELTRDYGVEVPTE